MAATSRDDAPAAHPFDVNDLVRLKRLDDPQLSPDGSRLLFTVQQADVDANKTTTAVFRLDLSTPQAGPVQLVDEASSPRWSTDGGTVYFLSSRSGRAQLWRVPIDGGDPVQVTYYPVDVNNFLLAPDGIHVAVSMDVYVHDKDLDATAARLRAADADAATGRLHSRLFVRHWDAWRDGRLAQLFVDTLASPGHPAWVSKGVDGDIPSRPFGDAREYAFSPDSRHIYFGARLADGSEAWSTNFDIHVAPVDAPGPPRNLTSSNPAWDGWPVPAPDGRTLYYLAQKVPGFESDRFGIMALDLASGHARELGEGWDLSAANMQIAADGRRLYVTAHDRMQQPLFAIDAQSGRATKLVADGSVGAYAVSPRRIVVARSDLTQPVALYALDNDGDNLARLTHFNDEALAATSMGEVHYFQFDGANNDPVSGYVVTPAGFNRNRKYPVAFIIHGGPQGVMGNGWSYRWNPQTYAGQGFAVVAINFHGSLGFGQAFTDSISGDWGGKPLEDLKKGWAHVLGTFPFLDGDRAAALGASYGGFMINWMAGVWNEPWRCFVNHDGVFDTRMIAYATDELWFEEHEHGGPQFAVPANYERFNPVAHVSKWRVPMLVVHSDGDYRIPLSQGLGTFTALQRQGIPSQLLTFPDENHWVVKPRNSVMWHQTVNAWLSRWTRTVPDEGDVPGDACH